MIKFHLAGLGLGILFSCYTLVYFKYVIKIKHTALRVLWGLSHMGILVLVVFLSFYILMTYFPEIQSKYRKLWFMFLWFFPYLTTGLWGLRKVLKKRACQDEYKS
jgi:hypothetical protein